DPGHSSFSRRQDGAEPSAGRGQILSGGAQRRVRQQTIAGRLPGAPAAFGVRRENLQTGLQKGGRLRLRVVEKQPVDVFRSIALRMNPSDSASLSMNRTPPSPPSPPMGGKGAEGGVGGGRGGAWSQCPGGG